MNKMNKIINQYISLNKANDEVGELHIEGDISDTKWWDEDVTPKEIIDTLKEIGDVGTLDIYINSGGGSCFAGNSIVSIIDDYKLKHNCKVNVHIRGLAASMGSGIAMVGDHISMADNALFMLHRPATYTYGNAEDLEKNIELLNKTEHTLVKNYMRKFNGTEDELREIMADETWLTADEAKEYGFVDEVTEGVQIAASAKGLQIDNIVFNNKFVDLINKKLPQDKISKKEESSLNYDETLNNFGISEEFFATLNLASDKVLEVVNLVKDAIKVEPVAPFVEKEAVLNELGCEDITAEELINYAKIGLNPPKVDDSVQKKAEAYDEVVNQAKEAALKNALRANGDLYDEERTRKMLNALDYNEIKAQDEAWQKEAEKVLNAGKQISNPNEDLEKNESGKYIDYSDIVTD